MDKSAASASKGRYGFLKNLSLQQRLPLLIFLLLFLTISAFTIISYITTRNAALRAGEERLNSLGEQLSSLFGQSAQTLVAATRTAAGEEVLLQYLKTRQPAADTAAQSLLNRLRPDSSWLLAELADASGKRVLHSARPGTTIPISAETVLSSPDIKSGSAKVGKLYSFNDSVIYPVIAPILEKKKITGYLLRWRLQTTSERAITQFSQLLGTGAKFYIGNADESFWTDLRQKVTLPKEPESDELILSKSIVNTDWQLRIEFSRTVVLQSANRSLQWFLLIGGLLLLLGFILTRILSRSITRPINKLTAVASAVAGGHYSLKMDLQRGDELGQLAVAFNTMMEKIRNASQMQEATVRERTAELEKNIAQLMESEDKFRGLLEAAPDAMVIVNDKGEIVLTNKQTEALFLYTNEELKGKPVEMLLPGPDKEKHIQHRAGYFKHPRFRSMGAGLELFAVRKDGIKFPVEISLSPLETSEGMLVSAAIRDITERKQADESIRQLNKELESFTYSVSHDLRSPLRIIDGYADMLIEDYSAKLDENGNRTLGVIKSNARRMGQLIDDLLSFSHTGRKEMIRQLTDMNKLVKNIIDEQFSEPGNITVFKLEKLDPAECDSSLIRQVWINLISNAVKYSGKQEQPVIEINSYLNGHEIVYTVKDNGVGFDMKYADKLFGVFQRLHKVTEFEGTGIGLALVNRIILKHGGRIWAEAMPGRGATFSFSLPV